VALPRSSKLRRGWLRVVDGEGDHVPESDRSEEQLIDAVERGDTEAAGLLYDRLFGVVDGTLCRVLGGRGPDHDDLIQAAFEQILTTLVKRKFARVCSLAAWGSSITAHLAFNAIRSRVRERKVLELGLDVALNVTRGPHDVEREAGARLELDRLRLHLAEMNPDRAKALFLHDVLGHGLAEIAVIEGCSVAAAQSRLVRARSELLRRMTADAPSTDEESAR
jgi:RNA polymerase sigma-70 factor (ECF subfamily)